MQQPSDKKNMRTKNLSSCLCAVGSFVFLGVCAESAIALPGFSWSQAGVIPGKTCVRIYETADPDAW